MPAPRLRILIVDRDPEAASSIASFLESRGHETRVTSDAADACDRALGGGWDVVTTGYRLESMSGLELVARLHSRNSRLPVIMLAGDGSSETAIKAIRNGAYDFLTKPVDPEELLGILSAAVRASRTMAKPVEIGKVYDDQDTIIGRSRAMTAVYKELGRIASQPVTVLIRGETGTGKDLIARAIYQHGHRAHKPFIAVNCAAIPPALLESEIFGHEKGAFTGAEKLRIGRFEQAHNGTLFLDEIGDMDLALQAKLLRVLQEKRIHRVGGTNEIQVDVRVIAATHRDLEEMIETGTFRPDLYYRLNVASVTIPPLRDRVEDIPALTEYFLQVYGAELGFESAALHSECLKFLQAQDWPGNVRQLQNVLRKALLHSRGYGVRWEQLRDAYETSQYIPSGSRPQGGSLPDLVADAIRRAAEGELEAAYPFLLESLEREAFSEAMRRSGGNQAGAARLLGISRFTLREKLHRYGLHPAARKPGPDEGSG